jgi:DNA-binding NtrC family response regulator
MQTASTAAPRLLLVDDETIILRSVGRLLERRGFSVRAVESAEAAIELLDRERFDAIVCDLHLPGMSAEDLHARLAARLPDAAQRFILATGDLRPASAFVDRTGCPCLEKPYELTDLLDMLHLLGVGAPARSA